MLGAVDPATREYLSAEDVAGRAYLSPSQPAGFVCYDDNCQGNGLVWKEGAHRAPHWAHRAGHVNCSGAGMSLTHLNMQNTVFSWRNGGLFDAANKEFTLKIPDLPLRTLPTRRLDVLARMPVGTGQGLRVAIECQHSPTDLSREERRIRDINLYGLPVLLIVSAERIHATRGDQVKVPAWIQDWALRHGRQQVAVLDESGQLWWLWFDHAPTGANRRVVRRAAIRPGMLSNDGRYELKLCVDATRPQQARGQAPYPSLCIAAFAWTEVGGDCTHHWTTQSDAERAEWQPQALPQPIYLGTARGIALFDSGVVTVGGF